jgi:hypothetical protein
MGNENAVPTVMVLLISGARTWLMAVSVIGQTSAVVLFVVAKSAAQNSICTNPVVMIESVTRLTAIIQLAGTENAAAPAMSTGPNFGARTCQPAMSATGINNALGQISVVAKSAVPSTICTNPAVETTSVTRHTATIQ